MNLSSTPANSLSQPLQIEGFTCGPLQTNVYLLLDPETREAVVIDPSIETDAVLHRALEWRAQGIILRAIWNTHGHFDHIYDNARWRKEFGVPIHAHPADNFFLDSLREQSLWFGMPEPELARPDFAFEAGQTVSVGNHQAQVLHLPGHSPGSVGFHFADQQLCIVGDVLFQGSVGRTDLPGCSNADLAASVRTLFAMAPETVILPGHGDASTIGAEKRDNEVARELLARY